jgi:ATP-dependent Clp protease ATP-binding subunit ClpC
MDPVIGRQQEVLRVTQILARKKKNNPVLLGEPGVGKTAIAEGLARAIVTRTNADGSPLPAFMAGKRVMQLDVGLLIAGAKVGGRAAC